MALPNIHTGQTANQGPTVGQVTSSHQSNYFHSHYSQTLLAMLSNQLLTHSTFLHPQAALQLKISKHSIWGSEVGMAQETDSVSFKLSQQLSDFNASIHENQMKAKLPCPVPTFQHSTRRLLNVRKVPYYLVLQPWTPQQRDGPCHLKATFLVVWKRSSALTLLVTSC